MYFFVCYDPDEIKDFSSESARLDAVVDGLSRSLGVSADSCRVSKAVSYSRGGALAVPDGVSSFNALLVDFD